MAIPDVISAPSTSAHDGYSARVKSIVDYVRHQTRLRRIESICESLSNSSPRVGTLTTPFDPACDVVMTCLGDLLELNKVEAETNPIDADVPPHGKAWARVCTNIAPPEDCKQEFFVPYLGEADEDLDASSKLAHDLLEEDVDTDKKAAIDFFDQTPFAACVEDTIKEQADDSDAEGELYEWNNDRHGQDYVQGAWDRAFKREAVFTTVKFFGPDKFSNILTPLSQLLKISEEAACRYFANALHRSWAWLKFDEHERVKRQHNQQIVKWMASEERTATSTILDSNSVEYFFCRYCKIHDCALHGVGAESKPKIVPYDSTRKGSLTPEDQQKIEQKCAFAATGKCWYQNAFGGVRSTSGLNVTNGVKEIDISKVDALERTSGYGALRSNGQEVIVIDSSSDECCSASHGNVFREVSGARALLLMSRKVMGDDFCRIAEVINFLGIFTVTCIDVGVFISVELEKEEISSACIRPKKKPFKRPKNLITGKENSLMKKGLRSDYSPCNHEGPCTFNNCTCKQNGLYCEKFCNCYSPRVNGSRMHEADWCTNSFRGCSCKTGCGTKSCDCNGAGRECDPDYCKCLRHVDVESNAKQVVKCRNVSLRMQNTARIVCGHSTVHGWGVYASGLVRKGDLIGQYTGEVIEQQDGERRGRVYDQMRSSFLFNTTAEYVVDSTRIGNKLRYINHSKNHNCSSRLMRVDGDVIVGIYASRDILTFEELLFDYGYGKDGPEFARSKSGKSGGAPSAKKRKLIAPAKRTEAEPEQESEIGKDPRPNQYMSANDDFDDDDDRGSLDNGSRRRSSRLTRLRRVSVMVTGNGLSNKQSKVEQQVSAASSRDSKTSIRVQNRENIKFGSKRSSEIASASSSKRARCQNENGINPVQVPTSQARYHPSTVVTPFPPNTGLDFNLTSAIATKRADIVQPPVLLKNEQPSTEEVKMALVNKNTAEQPSMEESPNATEPSGQGSIEVIDLVSSSDLSAASLSPLVDDPPAQIPLQDQ